MLRTSIWSAVIFASIMAITTWARASQSTSARCENLFTSNPTTSRLRPLTLAELRKTSSETPLAITSKILELKTHREQIDFARQQLKSFGVEVEEATEKYWFGIRSRPILRISTRGSSHFNQLAKAIWKKYRTSLVFDPNGLGGAEASANGLQRRIRISKLSAFSGRPDLPLFHEFKHIALSAKEARGHSELANGTAIRGFGRWPWGADSKAAGYSRMLSIQELSTWFQGFNYEILRYKELRAKANLTPAEALRFLTSLQQSAITTIEVIDDVASVARYERNSIESGRGHFEFQPEIDSVKFFDFKIPFYLFIFDVPRPTFDAHLTEPLRRMGRADRARYFETTSGQVLMRKMALSFLDELGVEAQQLSNYVDYFKNLEVHYGFELAEFFKSEPSPTAERQTEFATTFLDAYVATKTLTSGPSLDSLHTLSDRFLPETKHLSQSLLDIRRIDSRLTRVQNFVFSRPDNARSIRQINQFIRENLISASYGSMQLTFINQSRTQKLDLEWTQQMFLELEFTLLPELSAEGWILASAVVSAVDGSRSSEIRGLPLELRILLSELEGAAAETLNLRNEMRIWRFFDRSTSSPGPGQAPKPSG